VMAGILHPLGVNENRQGSVARVFPAGALTYGAGLLVLAGGEVPC
jgi:hypothetical protein